MIRFWIFHPWRATKQLVRRIFGRCGFCGGKKAKRNPSDIYTLGPGCRSCNKVFVMGRLYGAGVNRLRRELTV